MTLSFVAQHSSNLPCPPSLDLLPWQEAGAENLSAVTAKLSKIGGKHGQNANRDLLRYVRLPLDLVMVETVVLDEITEEAVNTTLPMIDPHEILDYAWRTGRIQVPKAEILIPGLTCRGTKGICRTYSQIIRQEAHPKEAQEVLAPHGRVHLMGCGACWTCSRLLPYLCLRGRGNVWRYPRPAQVHLAGPSIPVASQRDRHTGSNA